MKSAAQTISDHRIDRALLWSRLWLLRVAAFILQNTGFVKPLERSLEAALTPWLKKFAHVILTLIFLKAEQRLKLPTPIKRYAPHKAAASMARRINGARLRKLARGKTCGERLAALLKLLDGAEAEIARLAKRLRAGLMRRRGGVMREARGQRRPETPDTFTFGANTS